MYIGLEKKIKEFETSWIFENTMALFSPYYEPISQIKGWINQETEVPVPAFGGVYVWFGGEKDLKLNMLKILCRNK